MKEEMLVCKECGAKITKEALDYAEKHGDRFPEDADFNTIHADDCGCRYADEKYGDACHCEFVKMIEKMTEKEMKEWVEKYAVFARYS